MAEPYICSYGHQGMIFSLLYCRTECKPWIFSNYIQTFVLRDLYNADFRSGTIDFYYNQYGDFKYYEIRANPWIQAHDTPYEIISVMKLDIIELIKTSIGLNQYVCFDVDEYFISNYDNRLINITSLTQY